MLSDEQLRMVYLREYWNPGDDAARRHFVALRAVERAVIAELAGSAVDVEALACECESDLFTDEGTQRMMGSAVRMEIIADAIRTAVAQARVEWERECAAIDAARKGGSDA